MSPNLIILNSLFKVKANLSTSLWIHRQSTPISIVTGSNSHSGFVFKCYQNHHQPTTPSRKTTNPMPSLSTNSSSTNNILSDQPLSLTHSHQHNNHTPTTIFAFLHKFTTPTNIWLPSRNQIVSETHIIPSMLLRINRDVPDEPSVRHSVQTFSFDYHRVAKTSQIPFIFPSFDVK